MPIKTQIRQEGSSVFIELSGKLDFETSDALRQNLQKLQSKTESVQIIFDMSGLEFVGSSGISAFIQALREFNDRAVLKPKYVNVRTEFRRLFSAFDESGSFEFSGLDN